MHFEPHMLPSGHTLYEYRIERVLGAGGFGITYLGRDTHLGRWYAIKEYLPRDTAVRETGATVRSISATTQEDFTWGMDRFLAEAQTLAQFQHPNLVGVVRYFKANGTAYFVMDYVEGEVLASYIAREAPLSEAVLRGILAPVMDGLMQVHGAGYLHRDIKPDNIVLREDGSPVLVDFGAARLAMGARTRPLTAILTPGYAPIEQYSESSPQGPYTDIYALGAVLYYGLTGEALQEASDRTLQDTLPVLSAVGYRGVSQGFLAGIDAALKVYPRDRPISLESWRRMLDGPAREEVRQRPAESLAGHPVEAPGIGGSVRRWGIRALLLVVLVVYVISASEWMSVYGPEKGLALTGTAVVQEPVQEEAPQASAESPAEQFKEAPADAEVTRLLAAAEADLAARRLTRPAGNNAWEKYRRVLELEPAHPEALAGLERVVKSYRGLFDEALAQGEFDRAAGYLARIGELTPDSPLLAQGERRLAAARREEGERQAAEARARELAGEMVDIPGGTFRMGDLNGDGEDDEKPVHSVTVPPFKLGKYEVTVGQFRRFVLASGYRTDAERNVGGKEGCYTLENKTRNEWDWTPGRSWRDLEYPIEEDQPVVCVAWNDAQAYLDWLLAETGEAFRLPSEAEWEYAVRAGSETLYHFGDEAERLCEFGNVADTTKLPNGNTWTNRADCNDGADFPTAVGSYRPNAFGLYDMHGNVREWAEDCWNDSYAGAPADGSAWTSGNCSLRVIRGGAWCDAPRALRSANRNGSTRAGRGDIIGLRLAQDK